MNFLKDIAAKLDTLTAAQSRVVKGVAGAAAIAATLTFAGVASSSLAYVGVNVGWLTAFGVTAIALGVVNPVVFFATIYAATKAPSIFSAMKSYFSSKKEDTKEEKSVLRSSPLSIRARLAELARKQEEKQAAKPEAKPEKKDTPHRSPFYPRLFLAPGIAELFYPRLFLAPGIAVVEAPQQEVSDKPAIVEAEVQKAAKQQDDKPRVRRSARLNKDLKENSASTEEVGDIAVAHKAAKVVRFDTQRATRNNKNAAPPVVATNEIGGMKLRSGRII